MSTPEAGSAGPGRVPRFAAALSDAIVARGTTLAHLHRRLAELGTPVGLTTLSYWRSGQRRPDASSFTALAALETELGLASGELRDLLVGSARGPADASGRDGIDSYARALLYGPDAPRSDVGLRDDSVQHVLDVDRDGRPDRLRVRCLHRATRSGVDRRVLFLLAGPGDGRPGPFVALAGGHIGRTAADEAQGLFAAEFVFDRPLRRGETVVIEYEIDLGVTTDHFYELVIVRRLRHAMLWVRFHPERVPDLVEVYREVRGRRATRRADTTATSSVHHAVSDAAEGRIGVRWEPTAGS